MHRNMIETVMGAVVLAVAGIFLYFAYTTANLQVAPGYELTAAFFKLGGLPVGSDVRISGIKVGSVTSRHLDPETFEAVITMNVANDIKLPEDTIAAVATEGVLGGKYVQLQPGQSKERLAPGGRINKTTSFRSLEDQVGDIIFLATGNNEPK